MQRHQDHRVVCYRHCDHQLSRSYFNICWLHYRVHGSLLCQATGKWHLTPFTGGKGYLLVRLIDGFQSRDKTAMLMHKTMANLTRVLHNNTVKFPKDFSLFCSVHQHGGDDVRWKPPIGKYRWLGSKFHKLIDQKWNRIFQRVTEVKGIIFGFRRN